MKIDSDAVIWSAPERERAGRPLLVLLHGYASHEGDLFGLSPRLPLGPVIASVRAPIAENGGWAWFSRLTGDGPGRPNPRDVDAAARAMLDWLDAQQYTAVGLLGFSQGAAIALALIRLAPRRFAATVALSGFLPPAGEGDADSESDAAGDTELAGALPAVFWGRGTLDRVIPEDAIERTAGWLPSHSTATVRIYEDLAHSISPAELGELSAFLRENLR